MRRGCQIAGSPAPVAGVRLNVDEPSSSCSSASVAAIVRSYSAVWAIALRARSNRSASDAPPARERRQHRPIVGRIDNNQHVAEILGRRAHEARPTDVNLLDELRQGRVRACRRLREWIEIHDHEVDRADAVRGQRGVILRMIAPGQNAGVDSRVQRLDAPVHHLGKSGDVGHAHDRQVGVAQDLGSSPSRDQLPAAPSQLGGKRHQPGLVGHTQQGAHRD